MKKYLQSFLILLILTIFGGFGYKFASVFGYGGSISNSSSITPPAVTAINVPLNVSPDQEGTESVSEDGISAILEVPKGAVDGQTTFTVNFKNMEAYNSPLESSGAKLLNNKIFNIEARDIEDEPVKTFAEKITFTVILQEIPQDVSNLGFYYFNSGDDFWQLIPDAIFDVENKKVSFSVNHLTDFAVFEVLGRPERISVIRAVEDENEEKAGGGEPEKILEEFEVKNTKILKHISGRIILKVEENGEAYYVNPVNKKAYYLARPANAFEIMRGQGLGISNENLNKIPVALNSSINTGKDSDGDGLSDLLEDAIGSDKNNVDSDGDGYDDYEELKNGYLPSDGLLDLNPYFSQKLSGRILLQVESHGEAWYVYGGKRYYLGRPVNAFNIMRYLGLGISDNDFSKLQIEE